MKTIKGEIKKEDRIYTLWCSMKERCNNGKSDCAKNYFHKGITVCEKWKIFDGFLDDMYEDYIKHSIEFGEKNTTIDRINGKKGYSKENCRWVTNKEQQRNRVNNRLLNLDGETKTVAEWAEIVGIHPNRIHNRLWRNWTPERAVKTPIINKHQ